MKNTKVTDMEVYLFISFIKLWYICISNCVLNINLNNDTNIMKNIIVTRKLPSNKILLTWTSYSSWVKCMYFQSYAVISCFIGYLDEDINSILHYLENVKTTRLFQYLIKNESKFLFILLKYCHYIFIIKKSGECHAYLIACLVLRHILKCNRNIIKQRVSASIDYVFFKYYFNYIEQNKITNYTIDTQNNCLFDIILNKDVEYTIIFKTILMQSLWPFLIFTYLDLNNINIQECFRRILKANNVININWNTYKKKIKVYQTLFKRVIKEHYIVFSQAYKCFDIMKQIKAIHKTIYCFYCGKCASRKHLRLCKACKVAFYCNKNCQKKDWKDHKYLCNMVCNNS